MPGAGHVTLGRIRGTGKMGTKSRAGLGLVLGSTGRLSSDNSGQRPFRAQTDRVEGSGGLAYSAAAAFGRLYPSEQPRISEPCRTLTTPRQSLVL